MGARRLSHLSLFLTASRMGFTQDPSSTDRAHAHLRRHRAHHLYALTLGRFGGRFLRGGEALGATRAGGGGDVGGAQKDAGVIGELLAVCEIPSFSGGC